MWKITVMYHGGSQSQFIDNRKGEISIQLAKSFYRKYKNTAKNITYQDYPIKDLSPDQIRKSIQEQNDLAEFETVEAK